MRRLLACAAAVALSSSALVVGAGSAGASPSRAASSVSVVGDGSRVTVNRSWAPEGVIRFRVSSTAATPGLGSDVVMFKPKDHVNVATIMADFRDEFSSDPKVAARGTRNLTKHALFVGLASVTKGRPATVTQRLEEGRYYLMDLGKGPQGAPALTTFTVRDDGDRDHARDDKGRHDGGDGRDADDGKGGPLPWASATVRMTSADRFEVRGSLPARGTVRVRNVSDTVHFMNLSPVKKGTTDQQVQDYFMSGSQQPPPFAIAGPSGGSGPLSPGREVRLTYDLPAGTYVMLCFVADAKSGMPHAVMGMHKVVTLR